MVTSPNTLLFVGIKGSLVALDAATGEEAWRRELVGADFVSVLFDGTAVYATSRGEVWCFDPTTGRFRWHNELKGLGRNLVSLASSALPGTSNAVYGGTGASRHVVQRGRGGCRLIRR